MSILQHVNVTICSPFRDSAAGTTEYFRRLSELDYPMECLHYVFVEGDSQDDTYQWLFRWSQDDERMNLVKCDTGKPKHGSVVNAERFAVLATVFNAALDAVDLDWSDYVLFLPSDIHYEPDLLSRLLAHGVDMVAPMVWMDNVYYDTWASSRDGRHWINFTRQWAAANLGDDLIQMDSIGGTVLIEIDVLRAGCRYTPDEVDRGLSKMARTAGFSLWIDPSTHVYHDQPVPSNALADLVKLTKPEAFRATVQEKYGFDCGERYAADFVHFWGQMNVA